MAERRSEKGTGPLKSRGQSPFRTATGVLACLVLILAGGTAPADPPLEPYHLPPPMPSPTAAPLVTTAAPAEQAPQVPAGVPAAISQPPEDLEGSFIQLEPPGPDRLFGRLESERTLFERIRQEEETLRRTPRDATYFPEEPVVSRQEYTGRHWPVQREMAEPAYLCYGRLLFEQKNLERYGWDLGVITPVLSAGKSYVDLFLVPYHEATDICRCYDCNTGYCLPGDPVPFLLYPPEWSATGAVAEGAALAATLLLFP